MECCAQAATAVDREPWCFASTALQSGATAGLADTLIFEGGGSSRPLGPDLLTQALPAPTALLERRAARPAAGRARMMGPAWVRRGRHGRRARVWPGAATAIAGPAPGGERTLAAKQTLPIGTLMRDLLITGFVGAGGFGNVYLAYDTALQRQVALKEYMPGALAARAPCSADVSVRSPRLQGTFDAGLRSFCNEARLLAHFDHPSLVKVHQFWRANQTAYMVMPYYHGPTLRAHVATVAAEGGELPDEATLRQWLHPLLDALQALHAEQCLHRDIAPDNILLTRSGPVLLDFGAARRGVDQAAHTLTVILKPGYSPIEQYGDIAHMAQGPWTDLYALAGVLYFCLTGRSPVAAVVRAMGDTQPRLVDVAAGRCGSQFLAAIDTALSVRPAERPQSVAEFRALLGAAGAC